MPVQSSHSKKIKKGHKYHPKKRARALPSALARWHQKKKSGLSRRKLVMLGTQMPSPPSRLICQQKITTFQARCVFFPHRTVYFWPGSLALGALQRKMGSEIKPGKHFETRIKSLPLTNDHGRYITATPARTLFFRWPLGNGRCIQPFHFRNSYVAAVSLLKPPCGCFRSETTTSTQKWLKICWNS